MISESKSSADSPVSKESERSHPSAAGKAPTSQWDHKRAAVFGGFGLLYCGGPGYVVYNKLYPSIFGAGTRAALQMTAVDLALHCPSLYFGAWYLYKEFADSWLLGDEAAAKQPAEAVASSALDKYRRNFLTDNAASVAVWLPLHLINFRFVPLHLRMPFMAGGGVIWSGVMSSMQFDDTDKD